MRETITMRGNWFLTLALGALLLPIATWIGRMSADKLVDYSTQGQRELAEKNEQTLAQFRQQQERELAIAAERDRIRVERFLSAIKAGESAP